MANREYLSKREQQIMEMVYERGEVTATEIQGDLSGQVANSTVRTLLGILERKGWLRHKEESGRYIYSASRPREEEARSSLRRLIQTFYNGSMGGLVTTLLSDRETKLSPKEIQEIKDLIARAESES